MQGAWEKSLEYFSPTKQLLFCKSTNGHCYQSRSTANCSLTPKKYKNEKGHFDVNLK